MKKFVHICLIILTISVTLTACEKNHDGYVTGVPSETTSLTLTEEINFQNEEEIPNKIILGVYNPFADVVKLDEAAELELRAAAEKIDKARTLIADDYTIYENTYFTDFGEVLGEENGFTYSPFNPKIAADEEELFAEIRQYFTENYISDEELRIQLFENDYSRPPKYRTVDGRLCARCGYVGVLPQIYTNQVRAFSYGENRAEIVLDGVGVEDRYHVFMTLVKSSNIWQADEINFRPYNEEFANIVKTGLLQRQKKLNNILGGGSVPSNPRKIELDGETYTETRQTMTIEEMREFFAETFRSAFLKGIELYKLENCGEICQEYTKKYIDDVYAQRDGVLYRKDSVPEWYLPQIKFDPYSDYVTGGGNDYENYYILDGKFFDSVTNESFSREISISYTYDYEFGWNGAEEVYYGVYIASELPIREK